MIERQIVYVMKTHKPNIRVSEHVSSAYWSVSMFLFDAASFPYNKYVTLFLHPTHNFFSTKNTR